MSKPIYGYEPAPEQASSPKRFRVYMGDEFYQAFAEQWEAEQYMDELFSKAEQVAYEEGEPELLTVRDDDSETVVAQLTAQPRAPRIPERPAFKRTDRPSLTAAVLAAAANIRRSK